VKKSIDRIRADYEKLAKEARKELQQGMVDTNVPDVESKNTALQ
jgi:hypothetical protein